MSTTFGLQEEEKKSPQQAATNSGLQQPVLRSLTVNNHKFEISSRYSVTGLIGQGAYGVVVYVSIFFIPIFSSSGYDNLLKQKVAIKKIFNVFEQDKEYQKRILREVKILRHFRNHSNIVSLTDLVPPRSYDQFRDVYIITDLMDSDMRAIVKSPQELTDQNIQYFLYQILRGIKFVHSANVLHRDIKPSNILLNSEMDVKICDFGLSRGVDFENDPTMSTPYVLLFIFYQFFSYVATRWYRAPELLLMWEKAAKSMDMWSIGCIFAELLDKPKRKVLFPGKNYLNQLDLVSSNNVCNN